MNTSFLAASSRWKYNTTEADIGPFSILISLQFDVTRATSFIKLIFNFS